MTVPMIVLAVPVIAPLLAFLTIPLHIAVPILSASLVVQTVLAISLRVAIPILIASLIILATLALFAVLTVSVVTALFTALVVSVVAPLLTLLTTSLRIAVHVLSASLAALTVLALFTALTTPIPVILALSALQLLCCLSGLLLLFLLELLELLHFLPGQIDLVFLSMSAAELKLFYRILLDLLFVAVLDNHLNKLTQNINTLHLALQTVLRGYIIPDSGQLTV